MLNMAQNEENSFEGSNFFVMAFKFAQISTNVSMVEVYFKSDFTEKLRIFEPKIKKHCVYLM